MAPKPKPKPKLKPKPSGFFGDDPYLSYSAISRYLRCPRAFKAHYLEGMREEQGYFAKLGTIMHMAARDINLAIIKERDENPGEDIQFAPEDVTAAFEKAVKDVFQPGELKPSDATACRANLEAYSWKLVSSKERLYKVEYDARIPYGDGYDIRFIIDRLDLTGDDSVEIIDCKNSFVIKSKDDLREDPQLLIYGYAVAQALPHIQTIRITQYMFRYGFSNSVTLDRNDFASIRLYLDEAIAGIKRGDFPERLNQWCTTCPARNKCKKYKELVEEYDEVIPEDNEVAHRELVDAESKVKILKKRITDLRTHFGLLAEAQGSVPVEGGKKAYRHKEVSRDGVDAQKADAIMMNYGVELMGEGLLTMTKNAFYERLKELMGTLGEDQIKILKQQVEEAEVIQSKKSTRLVCEKAMKPETDSGEEG